jgi:hypothetical protein
LLFPAQSNHACRCCRLCCASQNQVEDGGIEWPSTEIIHARLAWAHDFVDTQSLCRWLSSRRRSQISRCSRGDPTELGLCIGRRRLVDHAGLEGDVKFDGEFASKSNIYVRFWPIASYCAAAGPRPLPEQS